MYRCAFVYRSVFVRGSLSHTMCASESYIPLQCLDYFICVNVVLLTNDNTDSTREEYVFYASAKP